MPQHLQDSSSTKRSEDTAYPPKQKSKFRSRFRTLLLVLTAIALSLVSMSVAARGEYHLGPGTVLIQAQPDLSGSTVVSIPPFGSVRADTHLPPVRLQLAPQSINPDSAQTLVESQPTQQDLIEALQADLTNALMRLTWRVALAGLFGGLFAALLFRTRSASRILSAALIGTAVPVALYGATFVQYHPEAFRQPTLTGALSRSPELLGPVHQFGQRFQELRTELDEIGSVTFSLYQFLTDQSPLPPDAISVLHISDLHLNPVGIDVALRIADGFDVDMVIDSGDLTAEGTELEAGFAQRISEFSVPYVFVRGNHDSEVTAASVAAQPNARVLDGDSVTLEGLDIFGVGDPLFTPDKTVAQPTNEEQAEVKRAFASEVREQLDALRSEPHVAVLHDRIVGSELIGQVPLILFGHSHRFEAFERDGTWFLGVASTGGAGLKSLAPNSRNLIGAQVLYFDRETRQLLAYDRIEVQGPQQDFTLRRTLVHEEFAGARKTAPTPQEAGVASPGPPVTPPAENPPAANLEGG
ncbi:MAG: metallophosphoesterase [Actinomycetota bacterium]